MQQRRSTISLEPFENTHTYMYLYSCTCARRIEKERGRATSGEGHVVQASQILYTAVCISSLTGVRVGQGLTYR